MSFNSFAFSVLFILIKFGVGVNRNKREGKWRLGNTNGISSDVYSYNFGKGYIDDLEETSRLGIY